MKRAAILIEASKIKDHADLPGARADVENFKNWLRSNAGGAWEASEISTLSHPSEILLDLQLMSAIDADYVFVAFSGHGEHVKGYFTNETRIQLNDREAYSALKLGSRFKRATVVVDACRNVRYLRSLTESVKESRSLSFSAGYHTRELHRRLFDAEVSAAEEGVIYLYGCGLNQSASDFPNGGAFSFALCTEARGWAESARGRRVYSVVDAFSRANEVVSGAFTSQTPVMEGSLRRNRYFPFGVVT